MVLLLLLLNPTLSECPPPMGFAYHKVKFIMNQTYVDHEA
jgi:hypothetical protein